ncbi:MAG: hypothetical protein JWO80_1882 [Bryobacterales bacterium]|nr:hypothetical protein [Bryobacterales bacterium]
MDAYSHLDMEQANPIADIEERMRAAAVTSALLVETWDGRNRPVLENVLRAGDREKFSVALCYRKERSIELLRMARAGELPGIRMSTTDMHLDEDFCRNIRNCGSMLIAHAEAGIGALCHEVTRLCGRLPWIRIYVPHLGWPMKDGVADPDWEASMRDFAALPSVVAGISAIAHFSSCPFPHDDVKDIALQLISQIPPQRIAIGSDFPLFEKERYGGYMALARNWVTSLHPEWSFTL